jgi:hypothetical protein
MWHRALIVAAPLGAVYGLLGLEAASPLAIVLIIWAVGILVLAWRLPVALGTVLASGVGFLAGFGMVWIPLFTSLLSSCKAPFCETADPTTDVFYALALVVPVIALAGAEIGLRKWLSTFRPASRGK